MISEALLIEEGSEALKQLFMNTGFNEVLMKPLDGLWVRNLVGYFLSKNLRLP